MVIYLLGMVAYHLYSERVDYLNLSEQQAVIDWAIKFVRDAALSLYICVSIVWGIWSYNSTTNKTKAKWAIFFPIAFGLFLAVSLGVMYHKYDDLVEHKAKIRISDNPVIEKGYSEYLSSSVHTVQEMHENTLLHASTVYMESGKIIEVLDPQGNIVRYEPTVDDIQFRKKAERVKVLEQHTLHSLKMAWLYTVFLLIASFLIACVATGVRYAYNQQLKRTT